MNDLLADGAAWLERQRAAHCARPVLYQRRAQEAAVEATIGRTVFELAVAGGVSERVESRDYLIPAVALVAFGLPQRGDRIVEEVDGLIHTHEVLSPGREPHWRWSDENRQLYRIHTKHLRTESA